MKLICVNNISRELDYIPPITIGNIYETIMKEIVWIRKDNWLTEMNYKIINDKGFNSWELKENFITLEEWRQQQINKIIG
jgi:hypothetical protein